MEGEGGEPRIKEANEQSESQRLYRQCERELAQVEEERGDEKGGGVAFRRGRGDFDWCVGRAGVGENCRTLVVSSSGARSERTRRRRHGAKHSVGKK